MVVLLYSGAVSLPGSVQEPYPLKHNGHERPHRQQFCTNIRLVQFVSRKAECTGDKILTNSCLKQVRRKGKDSSFL